MIEEERRALRRIMSSLDVRARQSASPALLAADSGRVPDGIALTAHIYWQALDAAGA